MPRLFLFPLFLKRQASVLIVCLWAFAVLSVLSLSLAGFVFQQIRFANFFQRSSISLPIAKAGIRQVFSERKDSKTRIKNFDTQADLTEENTRTLCGNVSYKYYLADKKNIDGKEVIIDESALVNLNSVSRDILARLPGMDEELAQEIILSPRRTFKLKEELLLVEDMTLEIYNQLKDFVTVYGNGKININTATPEVLAALGFDHDLIETILEFREEYIGSDEERGTIDDGAFTNESEILTDLRKFSSLYLRQEQDILLVMNLLTARSEYLRVNIIPQIKGKAGMHYSLVTHPESERILNWAEN